MYNTVFKNNFEYSGTDKPTENSIITPAGFSLPVKTASVYAEKITASFSALITISIFAAAEVNLTATALVCFSNPVNPEDKSYQTVALSKDIDNFSFDQAYDIQMDFDVKQKLIAGKYGNSTLYLNVSSKTADGKVVQYSSTSPKVI